MYTVRSNIVISCFEPNSRETLYLRKHIVYLRTVLFSTSTWTKSVRKRIMHSHNGNNHGHVRGKWRWRGGGGSSTVKSFRRTSEPSALQPTPFHPTRPHDLRKQMEILNVNNNNNNNYRSWLYSNVRAGGDRTGTRNLSYSFAGPRV